MRSGKTYGCTRSKEGHSSLAWLDLSTIGKVAGDLLKEVELKKLNRATNLDTVCAS